MSEPSDHGVVRVRSAHSLEDTVERILAAIKRADMTFFAQIDQQAAAAAVGLQMRPMKLLVFGSPRAGTPLMQAYPTLALDLPLKALVWEDKEGQVWVNTNSPGYLQNRHGMKKMPFEGVIILLQRAVV